MGCVLATTSKYVLADLSPFAGRRRAGWRTCNAMSIGARRVRSSVVRSFFWDGLGRVFISGMVWLGSRFTGIVREGRESDPDHSGVVEGVGMR